MKTQQAVQVVRVQNELQLNPIEQEKPPADVGEDSKPLLNILCEDDSFYLECCTNQLSKQEKRELNEQMFVVVRSLKHHNQKIEYDIQ
eukprot:CAMPEP_0170557166 /NCGR_PEP_ID=MMETSP0211-20121228/19245_1 /TAXON_ID=311385 /ORGANISM="Pseudokeronopsis sp., Strain OXSARD2" /LENGTH=87 /DNA_ID=CAMNT_0010867917 /DNA_START=125 /DNA_END=388 /DNA_ORIENTATION=-